VGSFPFSWSASRHDSFASCRRRYYYAYYAALEDAEIRRLKKLSALPLWAGSLVHDAIERFLRENDSLPPVEVREAFVRAVVHETMVRDWRESEAHGGGFRLFEHEYDVPVEAEDKRIAVNVVMRSLRAFFRSRTLARALELRRARWLALEDLVSFQLGDTEILLRMDLAYREEDGRVVIVDWKTGRGEGRFNEVQIAGYALYAVEEGWVDEPEQITTELSYLVLPKTVRRTITRQRIEAARSFIEKSARDMKALLVDPLANLARLEDFARVDRPTVCRRCNFRRLCFPREAGAVPPGPEPAAGLAVSRLGLSAPAAAPPPPGPPPSTAPSGGAARPR
jgi:hypothetical protein